MNEIPAVLKLVAEKICGIDGLPVSGRSTVQNIAKEACSLARIDIVNQWVKRAHECASFGIGVDGTTDRQDKFNVFTLHYPKGIITLGIPHMAGGSAQDQFDALTDILIEMCDIALCLSALKDEAGHFHMGMFDSSMGNHAPSQTLLTKLITAAKGEKIDELFGDYECLDEEKELLCRVVGLGCGMHKGANMSSVAEHVLGILYHDRNEGV